MPWDNNQNNGQGPWGNNQNNSGGNRGGGGGGGNAPIPPDLDELLKKGKDQFDGFFGDGNGKNPFLIIGFIVLAFWLSTGIYTIDPREEGVVLRFGAFHNTTKPGIHYHLPTPIEQVVKISVEQINRIEIGVRTSGSGSASNRTSGRKVKVLEESLMLTGDENISDVSFEVQWKVSDAPKFLFDVKDPTGTVKAVAESAMREVIGQVTAEDVLTGGKSEIERQSKEIMTAMLFSYKAGIEVLRVKLLSVEVPEAVSAAYKDVQNAKIDRESAINQAEAYRNDILPRARGEAEQLIQQAEGYRAEVVAAAQGDASRFIAVYDQYKNAKAVTRERIYLETMEEVFQDVDKVLLDNSAGGSGVVPYLPLNELKKR